MMMMMKHIYAYALHWSSTFILIHNYVNYVNSIYIYMKTYLIPLFMYNVNEPLQTFIFVDYNTIFQSNQSNVCCKHTVYSTY